MKKAKILTLIKFSSSEFSLSPSDSSTNSIISKSSECDNSDQSSSSEEEPVSDSSGLSLVNLKKKHQ